MSSSTVLYVFLIGLCVVSVQGLTLRLKGKKIIPVGEQVEITDLPVGGCIRYDTLECLSDMEYQGSVLQIKAYWMYNDTHTLKNYRVDDIRCIRRGDECESSHIGWQSSKGIYRKGNIYYNAVKLGRRFENATIGLFTCHVEGDSNSPVSVKIVSSSITPAPTSPPPPPPPDTTILLDPPISKTPIPSPDPPTSETPIPSPDPPTSETPIPSPDPPTSETPIPSPDPPTSETPIPSPNPPVSETPIPSDTFPEITTQLVLPTSTPQPPFFPLEI